MTSYASSVPASGGVTSSSELSHTAIGQWGGVVAGILGGFATTVVLTTLGGALGLTAGTAMAANRTTSGATEVGVGAIVWILLTAVLVGLVGGSILARSSRPDRSYNPGTLGLVTWAGGIVLAALIAAPAAGGVTSGLGGAAAASAGQMTANRGVSGDPAMTSRDTRLDATNLAQTDPAAAERMAAAAEDAAKAATVLAWVGLVALLVSLGMTVLAAKWQRRKVLESAPAPYADGRSELAVP